MAGAKIGFGSGVTEVTGDSAGNVRVSVPDASDPNVVGAIRVFAENDVGTALGAAPWLVSYEADLDYRQRIALDVMLEDETFNYTAQNTGKYAYRNTTMTNAWATSGMTTNSGNITTATTGTSFVSYAMFPSQGTATLSADIEMAFTAPPTANTVIDFGLFLNATTNPYAPTDGAYFRLTAAGLQGVVNFNGVETATPVFSFAYTSNKKYQFILYAHHREVQFWINDGTSTDLYGRLTTPAGNGQPFSSAALPVAIRHAIVGGAAGAAISAQLGNWSVRTGGPGLLRSQEKAGNACYGSYQGLGGGTVGTLASYVNSADPTAAAALSNTAALVTGLGGQFRFNAAATAVTDGIVTSYQVPAGTASIQGRRLVITGVNISCANLGAAVATTATTIMWSLAFGHTAVSLATAEAAAAKAPRRIPLGINTWPVAAAIGAGPQNGDIYIPFDSGVYVNPGEFVALVAKFIVGTATASQAIWGTATFVYGWE
jgi:hypothetical protein